jgi:hypothetical protein
MDGEAANESLFFLALDCEKVSSDAMRWSLAGTDLVLLDRGDERAARRDHRTLAITIADPRMSAHHAR